MLIIKHSQPVFSSVTMHSPANPKEFMELKEEDFLRGTPRPSVCPKHSALAHLEVFSRQEGDETVVICQTDEAE